MSLTIKPRTTTVVLFQGDDLDPIHDRIDGVQRAVKSTDPRRIGDDDRVGDAIHDFDAFMEEAEGRAVKVQLQALPRKAYRAMLAEHPARMVAGEGNAQVVHEDDEPFGFNYETFGDPLVLASIATGQFDSDTEAQAFVDNLSDGDFSKLYTAAVNLNRSLGPDPKARLSGHLDQTSDETSPPPERLA